MPFPQITPLGTPPSRNNPATFRSLMDARMAEQNVMVTEMNALGAALNGYTASGVPFVTNVGGTANALTITLPERDAALTNMFFFAPVYSNTSTSVTINLNGEGAKPVKTPMGNNPPVGYLGSGAMGDRILPFVAVRSSGEWIVRRQDEYGSNSDGEYWKMGSGLLICKRVVTGDVQGIGTAFFGGYRSPDRTWDFPHSFAGGSPINLSAQPASASAFGAAIRSNNAVAMTYVFTDVTAQATASRSISLRAEGLWFL